MKFNAKVRNKVGFTLSNNVILFFACETHSGG